MDIQRLSMAMSQSKVINEVSVAVLSKSLDSYKQDGENLTKLMEQSVLPNLGKNVDIKV